MAAADGRVLYSNDAAGALLGCSLAAHGLSGSDAGREVESLLAQCTRLSCAVSREIGRDGARLHVTASPAEGGASAFALISDAAAQARAEERFRLQAAEIAHDLRAPTAAIQCNVEDMLEHGGMGQEERARRLNAVLDECRRIALLAGDMVDLSALGSGKARLTLEKCDLEDIASDCLVSLAGTAGRAGVAVSSELDSATPPALGDSIRVHQALTNLLANALNHTPRGGTVRVWADAEGDFVRLCVTDSGCGVEKKDLARIWDSFVRVGDPDRRRQGTGLGLAIVRKVAHLHGGEAGAYSAPGHGSTFWMTLPRFRPAG